MGKSRFEKSYAGFGLQRSFQQLKHALRQRKQVDQSMALLYHSLSQHEQRIEKELGRPVEDLRILEIGPGQGLERARYFGQRNEVYAIDLDVIPLRSDPVSYIRMVRTNGLGRVMKTTGRRLMIGRAQEAAWARTIGARQYRDPILVQGDICAATPRPGWFDLVISWSVFEHLPEPQAALAHVLESLCPGGVFYLSLHLYTSHSGNHDIRAFTGQEKQLPLWAHLRPSVSHLIKPSAYLNEWRLDRWRQLFSELAPGYKEILETYDNFEKYSRFMTADLRQELSAYTDEELFTVDAIYFGKKTKT